MIRLVTFEREYGSGASEIAAKVADRLGWKLLDQELTDEIARRLECPQLHVEQRQERQDPLYYRLFKSFMRGSFEGSLNAPRLKLADADTIREMAEKLVRAAAREGQAVIVGRGGAYYLADQADVFHVFTYAPFEEKVRRIQGQGKSQKDAQELVESVDRERADFIKQYFDVDWPARHYFHLMINSTLGVDTAAEIVLRSLAAVEAA